MTETNLNYWVNEKTEVCLYLKMPGYVDIAGPEVTQPAFSLHHTLVIVIGETHGYAPPTGL